MMKFDYISMIILKTTKLVRRVSAPKVLLHTNAGVIGTDRLLLAKDDMVGILGKQWDWVLIILLAGKYAPVGVRGWLKEDHLKPNHG